MSSLGRSCEDSYQRSLIRSRSASGEEAGYWRRTVSVILATSPIPRSAQIISLSFQPSHSLSSLQRVSARLQLLSDRYRTTRTSRAAALAQVCGRHDAASWYVWYGASAPPQSEPRRTYAAVDMHAQTTVNITLILLQGAIHRAAASPTNSHGRCPSTAHSLAALTVSSQSLVLYGSLLAPDLARSQTSGAPGHRIMMRPNEAVPP